MKKSNHRNAKSSGRGSSGGYSKQPSLDQLTNIIQASGLATDPRVAGLLLQAKAGGNTSYLNHLIQSQGRMIQHGIAQAHQEQENAKLDPFYPRPIDDEFTGEIPVAHILDVQSGEVSANFRVTPSNLLYHTGFFGRPGMGKTNATYVLVNSIMQSLGDQAIIWIFEPKSKYRHHLYPEFIPVSFTDYRDQLFEPPVRDSRFAEFQWTNLAVDMIAVEQYFQIGGKSELISVINQLKHQYGRVEHRMILRKLTDKKSNTKDFRDRQTLGTLINRFQTIVDFENHSRNVIVPFEEFATRNLIFETGTEITEIATLRTALLIMKLYIYKKLRGGHLPIHILIIEEARKLFADRAKGFGEPVLETIFTLAREMGIGFVVITQEPASISKVVKSNLHTRIAFPLSEGEDLMSVGRSLGLNNDQLKYYGQMSALGPGHALVKYGDLGNTFPVYFPDYGEPENIVSEPEIESLKRSLLDNYIVRDQPKPKPRKEPDPEPPPMNLPPQVRNMLDALVESPFLKTTELYKRCDLKKHEYHFKFEMIEAGLAEERPVRINKRGKTPVFLELTDQAYTYLGIKKPYSGLESFKHRLFKHLICKCLDKDGFYTEQEARTRSGHKMDVFSEKDDLAISFEVTLTEDNVRDNIIAGFADSKIKRVVIVTDTDQALGRIKKKTVDLQHTHGNDLEFKLIFAFTDNKRKWSDT